MGNKHKIETAIDFADCVAGGIDNHIESIERDVKFLRDVKSDLDYVVKLLKELKNEH